ncbi:hypothetical protein BDV96DRAFT_373263 [Lophiotrema nucula]|uniref:Uncharacterized protein n=1 Tax=Lophiotrema nucula TaxID=690887 RepID=A0A6A5YF20_9PLEO|nr:hypothetical protein BDV96DRAFT_373263 [Lophiotrema nucula]
MFCPVARHSRPVVAPPTTRARNRKIAPGFYARIGESSRGNAAAKMNSRVSYIQPTNKVIAHQHINPEAKRYPYQVEQRSQPMALHNLHLPSLQRPYPHIYDFCLVTTDEAKSILQNAGRCHCFDIGKFRSPSKLIASCHADTILDCSGSKHVLTTCRLLCKPYGMWLGSCGVTSGHACRLICICS